MPNKVLMIGGAGCIAVLLLLLAIVLGGPGAADKDAPVGPVDDQVYLPEHSGDERLPVGEVEGIVYQVKESGVLLYADRVVPRREPAGVIDVLQTTIRIKLAPGREMTIDADEGTIVAPDMHPQEGQLRGNVVITLYEAAEGVEVDTRSDRDVVIRMFFEEPVEFDLELQQIDSEGPLFLTGPQVEFHGRGLSMNFNQLRQRVERLVIEQGHSLRYIPKPNVSRQTPRPRPASAHRASGMDRDTRTTDRTRTADSSPTSQTDNHAADSPSHSIQYYLATFEALNEVRVGQDQYVVNGDTLSAVFNTKAESEEADDSETTDEGFSFVPASVSDTRLASAESVGPAIAHALASALGQIPESDPRSLAHFTDEDVVITWSGRLTVSPLEAPPQLNRPDDVMVTVKGRPASVLTDKGESISATRLAFLSRSAGLICEGSPETPVQIDSPNLGSLAGVKLSIDQSKGIGYVQGPGSLTGLVRDKDGGRTLTQSHSGEAATSPEVSDADARPISVAFNDRLDLSFYLKDDDGSGDEKAVPVSEGRIKAIRSADFIGGVQVDYDELDLSADRLTLNLLEQAPDGDDKPAVESLTAAGNVSAFVKHEDVTIAADRLVAYPGKDQLELFGTPESPARIVRPDAQLAGQHLVMDENAGTVHVPGPGSFAFLPEPDDPGKTIRVTWAKSMHYDDRAGTARFLGDIRTLSVDGADTNELMGDDLTLTFVKEDAASDTTLEASRTGGRRLAKALMTSRVRFRARSYATPRHEQLLTELYLLGPRMEFTDPGPASMSETGDAVQQVQVIGKGRMLITDKRPSEASPGSKEQNIQLAGRGRTAFEWSDRLVIDLTHGEMLMKGAVAMVHQSPKGDRLQLDCQDLAAELKQPKRKRQTGDGWLSDEAPKPELARVWADGGIRILTGDITVTCDHLLYEEDKREIILWSDEPNVVTYEAKGEPTPAKSSAFKWHRDTGRFEAFRLRTGTIPLRRSERGRN